MSRCLFARIIMPSTKRLKTLAVSAGVSLRPTAITCRHDNRLTPKLMDTLFKAHTGACGAFFEDHGHSLVSQRLGLCLLQRDYALAFHAMQPGQCQQYQKMLGAIGMHLQ